MVDVARARRLGERIQEIAAETLELKVKDPRLGFVTVTAARLTPDLRDATIFYTVYGTEEEAIGTAAALESAKGLVRSEIGKRTGIKFTPTIEFIRDALPETVRAIDDLLREAKKADQEVNAQAAKATYAGDADPYRASGDVMDNDL
ncbi:MAG: 30S ribosome-binding factor RbfA [Actinobacteria bacterium]|nr:30S ribosome-binding factor RbfA [Actinomycetota bacterium]NBY15912.1 30S ribosome-binding factor RbfA [Actinomycetota bacterium]